MVAQPTLLARTWPVVPAVPGAINLTAAQLTALDILSIATAGATSAQTTLAQIQAFFGSPVVEPLVTIESGTAYQMEDTDGGVVNRKTAAGALAVTLPEAPPLWGVVRISDYTGDIGTYPLSVQPFGAGVINGETGVLDYAVNYETTGFQVIAIDATTGAVSWMMRP